MIFDVWFLLSETRRCDQSFIHGRSLRLVDTQVPGYHEKLLRNVDRIRQDESAAEIRQKEL